MPVGNPPHIPTPVLARRWAGRALPAVAMLIVALWAAVVVAQPAVDPPPDAADAPAAPATASPAGAAQAPDQVRLRVLQVGLRDRARPGDWTGVLVEYRDSAPAPRDLILAIELADADGDAVQYRSTVASTPGQAGRAWLYARVPAGLAPDASLRVTAAAAPADKGLATEQATVGPVIGSASVALSASAGTGGPTGVLPRIVASIAVVGGSGGGGPGGGGGLGLAAYTQQLTRQQPWLATGHELTEILQPLRVIDLPDDWKGFGRLGELVWTSGGAVGGGAAGGTDPSTMTDAQAAALRHWVARGGHLVVFLGPDTAAWADRRLASIFPRVEIERVEGVPASLFQELLGRARPAGTTSSVAEPRELISASILRPASGASRAEAAVIMAAADGRPVVVRRAVGAGMVTVCGLDITSGRLASLRLVEAEVFWHRLLGRRTEVVDFQTLRDQSLRGGSVLNGTRREEFVDSGIPAEVNRTGRAAAGVLVALGVFAAYWLLAGPVAFGVLRRRGQARHSWMAFVVVATVFSLGTWSVAIWMRPHEADARHLTFLDAVHGTESVSARGWFSVFLPGYDLARVEVPSAATGPGINALASWDDGAAGEALRFTDTRSYGIDSRRADRADLPARSTVKTLQIDWAGPIDALSTWRLPAPAAPADAPRINWPSNAPGAPWTLAGRLTHGLPGALTDVTVIVVARQRPLNDPALTGDSVLADAAAFGIPSWDPGQVLDLSTLDLASARRTGATIESWLSTLASTAPNTTLQALAPRRAERLTMARAAAVSMFPLLEPPAWRLTNGTTLTVVRREHTQGMDLARWFTQPCIIVLGELKGAGPVPLMVDGRAVASDGRTIVRWVYPLEPNAVRPAPQPPAAGSTP